MSAITIEEALKKFDKRFYSYRVDENLINIFVNNLKKYSEMTSKAISDGESEEHLKRAEEAYIELSELYNWDRIECVKNGSLRSVEDIQNEIIECIEKSL